MAEGIKRPLPVTEGRLMVAINNLIDQQAPRRECEEGMSEQTLSRVQDAINRLLDRERTELLAYEQERAKS